MTPFAPPVSSAASTVVGITRILPAVGLLALLVTPLACDESARGVLGDPCRNDSDCKSGLVCEAGVCAADGDLRGVPDAEDASLDAADTAVEDTTSTDTVEDTNTGDSESCVDGEERQCGRDVGECTLGMQRCEGGVWGECDGDPPTDEVCDGLDNDCDGQVDSTDGTLISRACGSNEGTCQQGVQSCDAGVWGPCKDERPPEDEICDGLDNDCDGNIDNGLTRSLFFADSDEDTYGDPNSTIQACQAPDGYVSDSGDCDDSDPTINPDGTEVCNGADDDCDNETDEGVTSTYYRDGDGDMRGDPNVTSMACSAPTGYVSDDTDCNDDNATVYEGATEICDGLDNDCDTDIDEGVKNTYYRDRDQDGFGLMSDTRQACTAPSQYADQPGDCDDTRDDVYPMAPELCDLRDNDCDMEIDEGCPNCDATVDEDFDGASECTDCDDTNGAVYPMAPEICDGIDNDCDNLIDEDFDVDGDGFATCGENPLILDCDDNNDMVNPGMNELCGSDGTGNGVDDNCNGYIDEGCTPCDPMDTDGDLVSECDGDCAPDDGDIYPGNTESCDGLDNDCNIFTVDNCDVSEPCNHDLDGDFSNDADVCLDDFLCACIVNASGSCQGDWQCTSFCNNSDTGPVGDGCDVDQTCSLTLLRSTDVLGCNVEPDPIGTKAGGEACSSDSECRSAICDKICVGPGCQQEYCIDGCSSDAYCASGAVCRVAFSGGVIGGGGANFDGTCWPSDGPFLGTTAVGDSCSADSDCDHGYCSERRSICTEACCNDSDCPSGFTCSLDTDVGGTNIVLPIDGTTCSADGDCPGDQICFQSQCAWNMVESIPMCVPDVAGQGSRQAGAACTQNSDCRSNFCDEVLSVCIEPCCSDSTCPTGLTCELVVVETETDLVSNSRVCLNVSTERVITRK